MSSDQDTLKNIVKELLKEPLTHLMLGHRELFHSNLLAWFFENLEVPSDAVFKQLTPEVAAKNNDVKRRVYREADHLDLRFQWPNRRPLVIENKVFSLPDDEQLKKYGSKIKKRSKMLKLGDASNWLLSMTKPGWKDSYQKEPNWRVYKKTFPDGLEWHWLSYEKLAELINENLPLDNNSYEVQTMHRYARVVALLAKLVERAVVKDSKETVALPIIEQDLKKCGPETGALRLCQSLEKLRASSIVPYIEDELRRAHVTQTKVHFDVSRSLPLIDWFGSIPDEENWEAGWQLQGKLFRLAIRTKGKINKSKPKLIDFAKKKNTFFKFAILDGKLGTTGKNYRPLKKEFGVFKPKFVWRGKETIDSLTVSKLMEAAVAIANKVKKM